MTHPCPTRSSSELGHADDGLVELHGAGGAVEAGVAEREDPPVGGDEPVPASGGCGGHADDGLVELHGAGGAVEAGVAEREDAPVGMAPTPTGSGDRKSTRLNSSH